MEEYTFYYGNQASEFERPIIPDIVTKKGIKIDMVGRKYNLIIKPTKTKVVVMNVYD